ncbi:hypothetical protein Ndes2526B_g05182 [Nannochloris sp. 'desiccata']
MLAPRVSKLRGLLPLCANASIGCLSPVATQPIWGHAYLNSKADNQDVDYVPPNAVPKEPEKQSGTYDEIKEAARRSGGDPVKEWMSGPSTTGSTVYKAAKSDGNQLYNATKRSVEDISKRYEESAGKSGVTAKIKEQMHEAADMLENKMDNMKEKFGNAVSSLAGDNGNGGHQAVNARAMWEASRSEKGEKNEKKSRKSELTDEVSGDNPKEKTPRFDKQTLPDPLDTPH